MEKSESQDQTVAFPSGKIQVGSLRCDKLDHEKNHSRYVCIKRECNKKRISCAHCYIEEHIGHNDIRITLEQFETEFKKKYNELANIIVDLGLSQEHNPTDNELGELIKRFDTLKEEFVNKIEAVKKRVIDDFQKTVYTTDVDKVRDLAKKLVNNNTILQVTDFKGISEEECVKFIEMHINAFREEEDLCGQLAYCNSNVRLCFAKLMNNMDKFRDEMFKQFETATVPLMDVYIEENFAAGQFRIFHKGCDHFPMLRYVPIFPCCGRAYPCAKCHDNAESSHKAKPALQIYCIKCKWMLENKYTLLKCPRCGDFQNKM